MEKQVSLAGSETRINSELVVKNFKNEISSMNHGQLNQTLKQLNYLALNLDPYHASNISTEEESILHKFGLNDYLTNPFEFTNQLLRLIDLTQEEKKKRIH